MGSQSRPFLRCCLAALILTGSVGIAQASDAAGKTQRGIASYYSDSLQGASTASGDTFDQQALTAAHPDLPFGTKVLVSRADTGQTVEVLINDRGPFVEGRIIDLSKRAAKKLGMLKRGTAPVLITQIN
ncbi:septal ring lytic transglycosylase RlpA family protein [Halomonas sp. HP20-15]|uniref:septal ring lytic transglycosylase RlpA family protein n=1 Tax=Halomonas sp. HP20-15 TaxID=3085901 RepID=UPI002980EC98|nr:septal ring lytic transglycosylase RlpA family protein [Halomonas sp. HP20-15]MDW5377171.1 septal ring lytic transglycosylase RlpA family protein [Halomonas sp. HP20-15]